jgi:hypothetical protein
MSVNGERGQSTVEWVGLLALVGLLLVALLASFGGIVQGARLAASIAEKLVCAAQLSSCAESADAPLAAAYGEEAAALVRRFAPELEYEPGSRAVPVDFRRCRSPACGDGRASGPVIRTDAGEPVTAFTHVVRRGGTTYMQYWLYYANSATLRGLIGSRGYHDDDWEGFQIRISPDGRVDARATSHRGYGGGSGPVHWIADEGWSHPSGWKPDRGKVTIAGGSHAGSVPGKPPLARQLHDAFLGGRQPSRWTPKSRLRLIPIEGLARSCDLDEFAITPPWCKRVYADPEYAGTD